MLQENRMPLAQHSQFDDAPESIREWTLEDATWQLQENRRGLSSRERQQLEPEFDQLDRLFSHLNRRWQRVVGDSRLSHPQMQSLNQTGAKALAISKLIYTELDSFPSNRQQIASPGLIAKLLRFNEERLNRLEIQLALLTSLEGYADNFFEILDELFHSEQMSPVGLVNLVDQIVNDVREDREAVQSIEPQLMVTIPGLSLQDYLPNRKRLSDSWVCAVGIQSARLTAFLVDGDSRFNDRLDLLIMAALLQDVGFLCLEQEHRSSPQNLLVNKNKIFQRHASIGAGMVAAVKNYPVELPHLVAAHHDRLDPSRTTRFPGNSDLAQLCRMMAVISRYVELTTTSNPNDSETNESVATADSQVHSAALQIRRDVAREKFDSELANLLLNGLEIQPIQSSNKKSPDADPENFTHFTKKKLRRDDSRSDQIIGNEETSGETSQEVPEPKYRDSNWRREVSRFSDF
jgi:hypothetical protein